MENIKSPEPESSQIDTKYNEGQYNVDRYSGSKWVIVQPVPYGIGEYETDRYALEEYS